MAEDSTIAPVLVFRNYAYNIVHYLKKAGGKITIKISVVKYLKIDAANDCRRP